MTFKNKLAHIQQQKQSLLCVGLDPDPAKLPHALSDIPSLPDRLRAFNKAIITATAPYASAFKINFAFYEALGTEGWKVLEETVALLPDDVVSIADAKRGDIGNSARFYAQSIFEHLGFDCCTVSPYMGKDSYAPFLNYPGKLTFILGRTSNPGAADLQEKRVGDSYLFEILSRQLADLPTAERDCAGLVVGATSEEALSKIRSIVPGMPFLIPGVGAQGGDPEAVVRASFDELGSVLINSSRGIIFAGNDADYADKAAEAADQLRSTLWQASGI